MQLFSLHKKYVGLALVSLSIVSTAMATEKFFEPVVLSNTTPYGVLIGGGAGAPIVSTAAGTAGHVLTANASGAPTFQAVGALGPNYMRLVKYSASGTPTFTITGTGPYYIKINAFDMTNSVNNSYTQDIVTIVTDGNDIPALLYASVLGATPATPLSFYRLTTLSFTGGILVPGLVAVTPSDSYVVSVEVYGAVTAIS